MKDLIRSIIDNNLAKGGVIYFALNGKFSESNFFEASPDVLDAFWKKWNFEAGDKLTFFYRTEAGNLVTVKQNS